MSYRRGCCGGGRHGGRYGGWYGRGYGGWYGRGYGGVYLPYGGYGLGIYSPYYSPIFW